MRHKLPTPDFLDFHTPQGYQGRSPWLVGASALLSVQSAARPDIAFRIGQSEHQEVPGGRKTDTPGVGRRAANQTSAVVKVRYREFVTLGTFGDGVHIDGPHTVGTVMVGEKIDPPAVRRPDGFSIGEIVVRDFNYLVWRDGALARDWHNQNLSLWLGFVPAAECHPSLIGRETAGGLHPLPALLDVEQGARALSFAP